MAVDSLALISEITILCLTIISSVLIIVAYVVCSGANTVYLASVAKNWNTGVIVSPTNSVTACTSSNYNAFISRSWPGTVTGCYNAGSFGRAACGRKSYGTTYGALPPMPYRYWRGSMLCTLRVSATYFDLTIVDNANSCPKNFMSFFKIYTLGNFFCFTNCI